MKSNLTNLLSISLVLLFLSCQGKKEDSASAETEQDCLTEKELKELETMEVSMAPIVEKLRLNGEISYDPNTVFHYISPVNGRVVRTYFSLGDQVKEGQVLAEIQSTELNELNSEIQQRKVELKKAEREWQATRDFHEDQLASEPELVAAESEVENLKVELENLEASKAFFNAGSKNGTYQILAPQAGFVVSNRLVSGMGFSADSDPLFTLSNLDKVWAKLNIYAAHIDYVKEDMPIEIKTSSYPNRSFQAHIDRIGAVMDEEHRVLKGWAVLENEKLFLKPGLHIEAMVAIEKDQEAIRIPQKAIIFHNDQHYVMIADSCIPQRRPVELIYQDETTAYVGKGLESGEKVITENALLFFEESRS